MNATDAQRAIEVVRWIAERVCDPAVFERTGNGLAGSSAGSALLFGALARAFPQEQRWRDLAHAHLAHAAAAPPNGHGLFEGWAGLLAAADYVAAGDAQRYGKLRATIRDELHRYVGTRYVPPYPQIDSPSDYDLICGFGGLLLVLDEPEDAQSVELLCEYVDWLTEDGSGSRWETPFHLYGKDGTVTKTVVSNNLGLAHGLPGILASISLNRRARSHRDLIVRMVEWIERRGSGEVARTWPCAIRDEEPFAEKIAWCYGTPGVAAALAVAGDALAREDLHERAAVSLAPLVDDISIVGKLPDFGLCHGVSGLAILALSVGARAGDGALVERGDRLILATIDGFDARRPFGYAIRESTSRWVDQPGLLGGSAGIALALLSAATSNDREWLRYFAIA